jgi:hypothetical protein
MFNFSVLHDLCKIGKVSPFRHFKEELMSGACQDLVHRHSLSDKQWEVLQKLIVYPPIGRPPEDERRNINGLARK